MVQANTFQRRQAVTVSDLTANSSTRQFPLGTVIEINDDLYADTKKFIYVKAHGNLSAYGCYFIESTPATAGAEVITKGAATDAAFKLPCVATYDITSAYYGWVQIEGRCTVTATGDVTLGNTGKEANGVATVTDESGSSETDSTIGVFLATTTGGAATAFCLLGKGKRSTVA